MHFSHQHTHASALLTLNDTFYPTVTFHVATLSFFIAPHTRFSLAIEKTECPHGFPGIRVSLHFRSMSPNRNLSTYYWVFKKYLFIWLCQVVVAALEIFSLQSSIWDLSVASMQTLSCDMWDLVSWPGIEPRPHAMTLWSLSHWTTRRAPYYWFWSHFFFKLWNIKIFCYGKFIWTKLVERKKNVNDQKEATMSLRLESPYYQDRKSRARRTS